MRIAIVKAIGVVAAAALVAGPLAAASPAHAAPVGVAFSGVDSFAAGSTGQDAPDCSVHGGPSASDNLPVVTNGPAVTSSTSLSVTFRKAGDHADDTTGSASASVTGSVHSTGSTAFSLDYSGLSSATLSDAPAASACSRSLLATAGLATTFSLTHGGVLTVAIADTGGTTGGMYVNNLATSRISFPPLPPTYSFTSPSSSVYLPPGVYTASLVGGSNVDDSTPSVTGTTTIHAAFQESGASTTAPTGRGTKYLAFAGALNCAGHSMQAAFRGRAGQRDDPRIKKAVFRVDGVAVTTKRWPTKHRVVTLTGLPAGRTVDVQAELVTRTGRTLTAERSYAACP